MTKKTLFLFTALALSSCAKMIELYDEDFSTKEFSISPVANLTKTIAEGTAIPDSNIIAFLPLFYSISHGPDGEQTSPILYFSKDEASSLWLGSNITWGTPSHKSAASENIWMQPTITRTPHYWPGKYPFMDYVAFSCDRNVRNAYLPEKRNALAITIPYRTRWILPSLNENPALTHPDLIKRLIPFDSSIGEGFSSSYAHYLYEYQACGDEAKADSLNSGFFQDILFRAAHLNMTKSSSLYKYCQDDLMYAYGSGIRKGTNGNITASFHHAEAWVKVIVKNDTDQDIYVKGISFNNVNLDGTLTLDHSKSEFEAYWEYPEIDESESHVTPVPNKAASGASRRIGIIPDSFLIPAHSYGPFESIGTALSDEKVTALEFKYLPSSTDENAAVSSLAPKLAGAMFPSEQKPGALVISYVSYPTSVFSQETTGEITHKIGTDNLKTLALNTTTPSEVTLNLDRQFWLMGRKYIYVITISDDDEISITPNENETDIWN